MNEDNLFRRIFIETPPVILAIFTLMLGIIIGVLAIFAALWLYWNVLMITFTLHPLAGAAFFVISLIAGVGFISSDGERSAWGIMVDSIKKKQDELRDDE